MAKIEEGKAKEPQRISELISVLIGEYQYLRNF